MKGNPFMTRNQTTVWLVALLLVGFLVSTVGCADKGATGINYSHVKLVKMSGKITLDGVALPYAQVFFTDTSTNNSAFGLADEQGNYTIMFNTEKQGIEPGEKKVEIWSARGGPDFIGPFRVPEEILKEKEKVPAQYNTKSTLTVRVSRDKVGKSDTQNFELVSTGG
jgi:hypothetical protein